MTALQMAFENARTAQDFAAVISIVDSEQKLDQFSRVANISAQTLRSMRTGQMTPSKNQKNKILTAARSFPV